MKRARCTYNLISKSVVVQSVAVGVPAAVGLSLVPACGGGQDAAVVVEKHETKADIEVPAENVEKNADQLAYTYNAVNRRDPFKTYFDELNVDQPDNANLT